MLIRLNSNTCFIGSLLLIFSCYLQAKNSISDAALGAVTTSVVRMNTTNQANDFRIFYKQEVLTQALEKTLVSHGPYEIRIVELSTTAARALSEVQTGKNINLFIGVTTREWEKTNIPIRIPIRRGILNYRVLAVNKNNLDKFSSISTITELKRLAAGVRVGWATTALFKKQSFNLYELESLDGLYNMLNRNAIDYIPRGINEIYDEIAVRAPNNLMVEPSLVIIMPAPTYIFVSPNEARLAQRIEAGLEQMISDGSLKALFYEFYADDIKKADIDNRRMIPINNPALPQNIPFDRPELWFTNDVK